MTAETCESSAITTTKPPVLGTLFALAILLSAPLGIWKAWEVIGGLNTVTFRTEIRPGDAMMFAGSDIGATFGGRCHWWNINASGADIKVVSVSPPTLGQSDTLMVDGRTVRSGRFVSCREHKGAFLFGFEFDDPGEAPVTPTPTMRP